MTRDPLEDFFARERAGIRELPGGPDHWDDLVRGSRRPRHQSWLPYLAGAAAVAVVVGGLGWNAADRGHDAAPASASSTPVVTRTATVTVTSPPRTVPVVPPTNPVSAPSKSSGPLPVPVTFGAVSLTNGGQGNLRALGSASCSGGKPCVSVVGSDDNGATWTSRSTFTSLTAAGMARRTPDGDDQLTGLRFATPDIGYAFGSKAFRSVDGGRHFDPLDVGGRRVLSLEVGGDTVWLVTATECRHGEAAAARGCTGLEVWSAPVAGRAASRVEALHLSQPVEAAWLSMDGADAYVSVSYLDQKTAAPARRVSGAPVDLPRPNGCAATGAVWVSGTANTRGGLVAVCQAAADAAGSYAVATSTDRGATWTAARAAKSLGTPGYAGVWLTAVDLHRLVAVTQGLPTSGSLADEPSTLLSSKDGGATWRAARTVKGSDGWSWAGAGGGDLVFALGGGAGSYDVSTDQGASFGQRLFRK